MCVSTSSARGGKNTPHPTPAGHAASPLSSRAANEGRALARRTDRDALGAKHRHPGTIDHPPGPACAIETQPQQAQRRPTARAEQVGAPGHSASCTATVETWGPDTPTGTAVCDRDPPDCDFSQKKKMARWNRLADRSDREGRPVTIDHRTGPERSRAAQLRNFSKN
jgi:hypothetical protein